MSVTEIGVSLPNAIESQSSGRSNEIVVNARPSAFAELVDVANPLQHVPLVSDIYRARSGDTISDGARLGGHVAIGTVVGGPVGALIGAGIFALEKLFGGSGAAQRTEAVGFSVRSEDRAAAEALDASGTEKFSAAGGRPQMSSSEFAALLSGFGTQKPEDSKRNGAEIAERMRANLDKLDRLGARE